MHEAIWQQRADDVIQQAQDFYKHARAAGTMRRQSGSRPVDVKCPASFRGCSFEASYDFGKLIDDSHALKTAQLKIDEQERSAYAARVRAHFWPKRCEIGLEKPACAPEKP
jgi:hypothetical protein